MKITEIKNMHPIKIPSIHSQFEMPNCPILVSFCSQMTFQLHSYLFQVIDMKMYYIVHNKYSPFKFQINRKQFICSYMILVQSVNMCYHYYLVAVVCSPTHFTVLTQHTYFSISNDKILFSISINVYI